jgi:hypothetical protein
MTIQSGKVNTKRLATALFMKQYLVPIGIAQVRIVNAGLTDIKITFDGDGPGDFVLIKSLDSLPVLSAEGGKTQLCFWSLVDVGTLELLMWG